MTYRLPGAVLIDARSAAGMNQRTLATLIGVTPGYLCKAEKHVRLLNPDVLLRASGALKVPYGAIHTTKESDTCPLCGSKISWRDASGKVAFWPPGWGLKFPPGTSLYHCENPSCAHATERGTMSDKYAASLMAHEMSRAVYALTDALRSRGMRGKDIALALSLTENGLYNFEKEPKAADTLRFKLLQSLVRGGEFDHADG